MVLSALDGASPNGTWKLYVNDHANPDGGTLVGWGLQIATDESLVLDGSYFEFNGGTLITRGAIISNGAPSFLVGRSGTTPAVWDVRSGVSNHFLSGDLIVGANSSFNQLILTNGAVLTNSGYGIVGSLSGANSNSATLGGAGSRWLPGYGIIVGDSSAGNRFVVSNGATAISPGPSGMSSATGTSNNEAVVTGPGSSWTCSPNNLYVGYNGPNNRLSVNDGGVAGSFDGEIGSNDTSSNNVVVITGSGSAWTNGNNLLVGSSGAGNQLVVSNSTLVSAASTIYLGFASTSTKNRLTVDSGTLRVTNATATGMLEIRRGTNVLNAGLIEVDTLRLTNALGFFEFNGGTLSVKNTTVNNGQPFRVGNGVSPATLTLAGNGAHSFSNGLTVLPNGAVKGNGSLSGPFIVLSGGLLSPGTSIGTIVSASS